MQQAIRRNLLDRDSAARQLVRYPARLSVRLIAGDLAMLALATIVSAVLLERFGHRSFDPVPAAASALVTGALWFAIFNYVGFYRRSFAASWRDEFYWVAAVSTLAIVPLMLVFTMIPHISSSRLLLVITIPVNVLVIGTWRAVVRRRWDRRGRLKPRIAFVGTPVEVQRADNRFGLPGNTETLILPAPNWPDTDFGLNGGANHQFERWFASAKTWRADRIVFTTPPDMQTIAALSAMAAGFNIPVAFASPEKIGFPTGFTVDHLGGEPVLIPLVPQALRAEAHLPKTIIDLSFATLGLLVLGPVMLITAVAVYAESRGPIFYRQERVGRNGKVFKIMKFRSMRVDAEQSSGAVWAKSNDDRTTRVGKFMRKTSLDELPQIFNVLRREMSIVGPRPERKVFTDQFNRDIERYDERHLVRPGITGLSHVYMARDVDASAIPKRTEYDLFYIEHWSPIMDLTIIFKTACEVLMHRIAA
ncbi:MAG TPA: sugar transferase [Candidatus Tumulicola sp.]|jgi:exopolysaccharide biosynthesis polyprenyl glycosylphosphotransferase